MLSYKTLDFIADSVNPLLGVIALTTAFHPFFGREVRRGALYLVALLAGVAIAYGLMSIDSRTAVASRFGLNYSTHTAVAFTLVSFLTFVSTGHAQLLFPGIFVAYALLMVYQQYHSLADIYWTLVVLALPVVLLHRHCLSRPIQRVRNASSQPSS